MATGTTTVDFGAFPGKSDTSVAITGQGSIVAGSLVEAWVRPVATSDHSADEHLVEPIKVVAGNISAGTGFTIYALAQTEVLDRTKQPTEGGREYVETRFPRVYGQWTVAWAWT